MADKSIEQEYSRRLSLGLRPQETWAEQIPLSLSPHHAKKPLACWGPRLLTRTFPISSLRSVIGPRVNARSPRSDGMTRGKGIVASGFCSFQFNLIRAHATT